MEQSDLPAWITPIRGYQAMSTEFRVAECRGLGEVLQIGPTCVIVDTANPDKKPPLYLSQS